MCPPAASAATPSSRAEQPRTWAPAGSVPSTLVEDPAGGPSTEFIHSAGVANDTTASGGASVFIFSSGTASGLTIDNGALGFVYSVGTAADTTVNAGGTLVILPGAQVNVGHPGVGTVISTGVVVMSAGTLVSAVQQISGALISGRIDDYVLAGGLAITSTINSGGNEYVYDSGRAVSAVIGIAGDQVVFSGGSRQRHDRELRGRRKRLPRRRGQRYHREQWWWPRGRQRQRAVGWHVGQHHRQRWRRRGRDVGRRGE